MAKIRSLPIMLAVALLLLVKTGFAQSEIAVKAPAIKSKQQATVTFNLQKVYGMGPTGNSSIGIGTFDPADDSERIKGYPKVKHKPTGLHEVGEYCYLLDHFQFDYQNYCKGLYSKDYFFKEAGEQKWNLADTVTLSRTPIKCSISVLTGYNNLNEAVYIIDANQNGDFGDDVLEHMSSRSQSVYEDKDLAVPVLTEYLAGKQVKQESLLVMPVYDVYSKGGPSDITFIFPEFRYTRFSYKGQSYFVCTDGTSIGPRSVYVMADAPNFNSIDRGKRIGLNQYVHLGDKDFKFVDCRENGNKVSIAVDDVRDFAQSALLPKERTAANVAPVRHADVVSNQLGFRAPIVRGTNFNTAVKDVSTISSADLKGKYIFVDFWATYCGPCIAEFPYIKKAYQKYDRSKFEVIGVLDERNEQITAKLIAEGNLVWPNIKMNDNSALKNYHVYSYPSSYLIDPEGVIIAVNLRGEELADKLNSLIKN